MKKLAMEVLKTQALDFLPGFGSHDFHGYSNGRYLIKWKIMWDASA